MHLKSIEYIPPSNSSKPIENNHSTKYLFNCEYTIERDNENPSQETFVVVPQLLLADLIKDARYDEYRINMEEVCRNPDITKMHKEEIRKKYPKQKTNNITAKGAILQKDYQDIYPVFRWECEYEILGKQKNGRISRTTETLGLKIDEDYCQKTYPEEQATKATHHDYNDP